MSVPRPDECHPSDPTPGVGSDGQGGGFTAAQDSTDGMSDETLEARLREALTDVGLAGHVEEAQHVVARDLAARAVVEEAKQWARTAQGGDPPELWADGSDLALIAAVAELLRIEGQR